MKTATSERLLTTGQVAKVLGIDSWQVTRLIKRHLAVEPVRLGRHRAFTAADLPALRRAAVVAGYLDPDDAD
jgi:hypothetical protein